MKTHRLKATHLIKAGVITLGLCSHLKALDVAVFGPLSVAATVSAPFVTAYAAPQTVALYNTGNLISPILNAAASYTMDYRPGGRFTQSGPGVIFGISTLRNLVELGMGVGAACCSYAYLFTGESYYNTIALTLTTVNAVLTTGGTAMMYGINFPHWVSKKNQ